MMHGIQKITLTHASVTEALRDYLQKHMGAGVDLVLQDWAVTPNNYTPSEQSIDVGFSHCRVLA